MRPGKWRLAAIGSLLLGFVLRSPWLMGLGAVALVMGVTSWLLARWSLVGLEYHRRLDRRRVFAGEPVELILEFYNGKPLPVAMLRSSDHLPKRIPVEGADLEAGAIGSTRVLRHVTALLPYERVTFRYQLLPPRGVYRLGPVTLETSDLFGLHRRQIEVSRLDTLIVYPRRLGPGDARLMPGRPLVSRSVRTSLVTDPSRPIGVRPMQPSDGWRHVHWKASARTGVMQVKILDPTRRDAVVVLVNAATFAQAHIGVDRERQDRAVARAAAIAEAAVRLGREVGVAANSGVLGRGRIIRVPPRAGRRHLRALLEGLAGVQTLVTIPFARLVSDEAKAAPQGTHLVIVTGVVDEPLVDTLARLWRSGHRLTVVRLDDDGPEIPGPVPVFTEAATRVDT